MSFAWLPVDVEIMSNHKTRRLVRRLNLSSPAHAVGHLIALWTWAMVHAPDGDLSHLDPEDIAAIAGWNDDPDQFVTALADATWIDKTDSGYLIHEWEDHQGQSFRKRVWEADRKRRQRETGGTLVGQERDTGGTPVGHGWDTGGTDGTDRTRQDKTREEGTPLPPLIRVAIEEIPESKSTPDDYARTIERHAARLSAQTIQTTIYELAEWDKLKTSGRTEYHRTLNTWLAKKPDEAPPDEPAGLPVFSAKDIPAFLVQS